MVQLGNLAKLYPVVPSNGRGWCTSTQTRRPLPVLVALVHLLPFLSLQLAIVRDPAVPPELIAQLQLLGRRHSVLSRPTHSWHECCAVCPSSSFNTPRAGHGTSFTRHSTYHQSLWAPQPLISVNNSSVVDRVMCLFHEHRLSENSLRSAQVLMRVSTVQWKKPSASVIESCIVSTEWLNLLPRLRFCDCSRFTILIEILVICLLLSSHQVFLLEVLLHQYVSCKDPS